MCYFFFHKLYPRYLYCCKGYECKPTWAGEHLSFPGFYSTRSILNRRIPRASHSRKGHIILLGIVRTPTRFSFRDSFSRYFHRAGTKHWGEPNVHATCTECALVCNHCRLYESLPSVSSPFSPWFPIRVFVWCTGIARNPKGDFNLSGTSSREASSRSSRTRRRECDMCTSPPSPMDMMKWIVLTHSFWRPAQLNSPISHSVDEKKNVIIKFRCRRVVIIFDCSNFPIDVADNAPITIHEFSFVSIDSY